MRNIECDFIFLFEKSDSMSEQDNALKWEVQMHVKDSHLKKTSFSWTKQV